MQNSWSALLTLCFEVLYCLFHTANVYKGKMKWVPFEFDEDTFNPLDTCNQPAMKCKCTPLSVAKQEAFRMLSMTGKDLLHEIESAGKAVSYTSLFVVYQRVNPLLGFEFLSTIIFFLNPYFVVYHHFIHRL